MKKEILTSLATASLLVGCGVSSTDSDHKPQTTQQETKVWVDKTAPVLSLSDKTFTTKVGQFLDLEQVSATDDTDGILEVVKTGEVDFTKAGTYKVVYSAKDSAGNSSKITHTYIVEAEVIAPIVDPKPALKPEPAKRPQKDTIAPVLSLGDKTFTTKVGQALTLETVSAKDDKDGVVEVVKTGEVDFTKAGTYKVVYTASDSAGNTSKITHTYIVEKKEVLDPKPNTAPTKPSITGLADITFGESINPTCNSTDLENDSLTYTYFVDGVEVKLPYKATTTWTKTFKCIVSDGKEEVSSEQTFKVKEKVNKAPTLNLTLTGPNSNNESRTDVNVVFDATWSVDNDWTIVKMTILKDWTKIYSWTSLTYTYTPISGRLPNTDLWEYREFTIVIEDNKWKTTSTTKTISFYI